MPTDAAFVDYLSTRINVQAASLKEALDFVVGEVTTGSAAFTANYNGYWLLAEKIHERALADKDLDAQRHARFALALILLATGAAPAQALVSDADLAALAPAVAPEALKLYGKLQKRQGLVQDLGVGYYPRIHALFGDLEDSLERFVFGPGYQPGLRIGKDTLIVTMGSCFAENIARFLASFGYRVTNFASPEEASPATFPQLVASILTHQDASARELIRNSTSVCIIYTAGVGEMVRLAGGESVDASVLKENSARMRSIEAVEIFPPETIAANIRAGFAAIRALNPQAGLVCTVSPVPLEATFDRSAGIMVANARSKAALMLGVHEACAGEGGMCYFPSYEMVKEWAGLAGIQAFAANDGSPRHVSRNLVLIICLMFVKHFAGEEAYRSILAAKTGGDSLTPLRRAVVQ